MEFSLTQTIKPETHVLIIPLFQDVSFTKTGPEVLKNYLKKREERKDFLAHEGEMLMGLPDDEALPARVVLWGLGEKEKLTSQKIRGLSAQLLKAVCPFKKSEIALWCPELIAVASQTLSVSKKNTTVSAKDGSSFAQALGEGLGLGNFSLGKFKTGKEKEEIELQTIKKIIGIGEGDSNNPPKKKSLFTLGKKPRTHEQFESQVKNGLLIAEAVSEVRDMVNAGSSHKTIDYLAAKSESIARQNGYKIKVLNKKELEKKGMFGILGVNRGSQHGAKMVVMEYAPKGVSKKQPPVVIVGKGIIFDSGGYNLKPSHAMLDMQLDMAGAGAVMGLFMLLEKLSIKQPVVGIFPLTDNVVSATSQKPADIVTTYSGKTVEIVNTDAEGRMVLCDAITYGVRHFKPRYLIDIATLTGACMVALGNRYAGVFGNDSSLVDKLRKAGEATDELTWPMPIHPDHHNSMKSKVADLRNLDDVSHAGASKAAAFLEEFVENVKWAHLDIAGTAFVKEPKKYDSTMATGYGVRLLLDFLKNL